ncbi:MAG: O-antigen ligase [Ilumatobacteraceae bacterium]
MSTTTLTPGTLRSAPIAVWQRPLWIVSGQFGIVMLVMGGWGAIPNFKPKLYLALSLLSGIGVVVLGPRARARQIIISLPTLIFVTWWFASYLWTPNRPAWQESTKADMPMLFAGVVIASLLPIEAIKRGLVIACHIAIGYAVFYTATHFTASSATAGVPGWHAGYVHKNVMAPFLIFAIVALISFEWRPRRRNLAILVSLVLIAGSQSTTTLGVGLALVPVGLVLTRLAASDRRRSRVIMLFATFAAISIGTIGMLFAPAILRARGKDLTLTSRTKIWSGVWAAIEKKPWQGYGVGGVWTNPTAEPTKSILRGLGFIVVHSHNGYLELLLQLGVIGLASFMCLIVSYTYYGVELLRVDMRLGRFMILVSMIVLVVSITEVATFSPWLVVLVMFNIIGLRSLRRPNTPRPRSY